MSPIVQETAKSEFAGGNYRSILKSTSLIGGASILNIVVGMVKTKFVAILLGPDGVGLMGMYIQITGLINTVSGLGLSSSGVRQIAEAVGTGNDEQIVRTVLALRRTVWLSGGLGMLIMILACVPISLISFDSIDYAQPIALLGVTVLLSAVTCGQACVLQGTRRLADLAKISVFGAANGTLISIPCFYLWGEQGIVPSLILCAIASLVTSWWFARRVPLKVTKLPWWASRNEVRGLIALGVNFMGAGLVTMLSNYLIRVLLLHRFDINIVGIYQAAFNMSGILVGFVLAAMGADFYPRLTAIAHDNSRVHQAVNEQAEISILLALPCLAVMMICAPLVIRLFYAESFILAIPILRWSLFGVLGRVFCWPLGFVVLAKGRGRLYFATELFASAFHLGALFCFTAFWGPKGAGIAFMVLYVFHTLLLCGVVRSLVGATWSRHTLQLILLSTIVMAILMLNNSISNNFIIGWGINLTLLASVTFFCFNKLSQKTGIGLHELLVKVGIK